MSNALGAVAAGRTENGRAYGARLPRAMRQGAASNNTVLTLKSSSGNSLKNAAIGKKSGGPEDHDHMSTVSREEIDAKIAASEARGDAKFAVLLGEVKAMRAEMSGDFKAMSAHLEGIERSTSGIKSTVIVTGLTIAALVVAVIYGSWAVFGIGMDGRGTLESVVEKVLQRQSPVQPSASSQSPSAPPAPNPNLSPGSGQSRSEGPGR